MLVLKNVKFRYTNDIYVYIEKLVASIHAKKPYRTINFDNINSFWLEIHYGTILLETEIMDLIYNTRVFNYDGCPLRNQKTTVVDFEKDGKMVKMLKISGEQKLLMWQSFEMIASVSADTDNNLLVLKAEKIKSMGLSVKSLMGLVSLNMEKLIKLKKGIGLSIKENSLLAEPFSILPPPENYGRVTSVEVTDRGLLLHIGRKMPLFRGLLPVQNAKNYIFIYKGYLTFGRTLTMDDGRLMMIDTNPKNYFDFFQKRYLVPLAWSNIRQRVDGTLIVYMPDYERVAPDKKKE